MNFDYLWKNGPEFVQSEHFRFGTDSVLLGNFVNLAHAKRAVDLGCASGVISLLMLTREPALRVTGVEIHREALHLQRKISGITICRRGAIFCAGICGITDRYLRQEPMM